MKISNQYMVYLALFSPCAWNPLPNSGILTLSANLEVREGVSIKTSDRIHFFLLKGRIRIQFFFSEVDPNHVFWGVVPDPIVFVPDPPLWKEQGLELGIYGICINIEKIISRRAIFLKKAISSSGSLQYQPRRRIKR